MIAAWQCSPEVVGDHAGLHQLFVGVQRVVDDGVRSGGSECFGQSEGAEVLIL